MRAVAPRLGLTPAPIPRPQIFVDETSVGTLQLAAPLLDQDGAWFLGRRAGDRFHLEADMSRAELTPRGSVAAEPLSP